MATPAAPHRHRPHARALAGLLALALVSATACAAPGTPSASRPSRARGPKHRAPLVVLETVQGDITLELDPAAAPRTVANFTQLVKRGFYDSLTFHRVARGFVIQGGDPNSRDENPFNDGQGGPGYTLPAEIRLPHVQGAVAMARQGDDVNPSRASSGSQFYIALRALPHLDGAYTVFGRVVAGWDAVERIEALSARTDIARVGENANPGRLAMIRHARLATSIPADTSAHRPH